MAKHKLTPEHKHWASILLGLMESTKSKNAKDLHDGLIKNLKNPEGQTQPPNQANTDALIEHLHRKGLIEMTGHADPGFFLHLDSTLLRFLKKPINWIMGIVAGVAISFLSSLVSDLYKHLTQH
jgi:hypothetical protein